MPRADLNTFATLDAFLIVYYRQVFFNGNRVHRAFFDALSAGDTAHRAYFDHHLTLGVRRTANIHFRRLGDHPDNISWTFLNTEITGPALFGDDHWITAVIYYNSIKWTDIPASIVP